MTDDIWSNKPKKEEEEETEGMETGAPDVEEPEEVPEIYEKVEDEEGRTLPPSQGVEVGDVDVETSESTERVEADDQESSDWELDDEQRLPPSQGVEVQDVDVAAEEEKGGEIIEAAEGALPKPEAVEEEPTAEKGGARVATEAAPPPEEPVETEITEEARDAELMQGVVEEEEEEEEKIKVLEEPDRDFWDRAPWMGGLVLILLGAIFLLRNWELAIITNWWAVFLLIPAIGALINGIGTWVEAGRYTSAASSALVGGLIMLVVAVAFLFTLDWSRIWPIFLLIIGLAALVGGFSRD
jgi:hypothetical protein